LLFVRQRGRRHLQRTVAGDALYEYACETVAKSRDAKTRIQRALAGDVPAIAIAAPRLIANKFLPSILADLLAKNPTVQITLHSETQERVWQLINSGAVDIGFVFAANPPPRYASRNVGAYDLVFIASPANPLAGRASVNVEDLREQPFVGGLKNSEFYQLVVGELARIGLKNIRVVLHLQDGVAVTHAVARNAGIAYAFRETVADLVRRDLVILPVAGPQPRLNLFGVRPRRRLVSSAVDELLATIETKLAE
jgi:DNA-binding transcriptional LysR family regulator